jgi:hypothetical protein
MVGTILEATFTIIIFGLILAHADAFSAAVRSVGTLFTSSVQTLSGVAGVAG